MEKLDVTERIHGKLKDGNMILYLDDEQVGEIQMASGTANYQLSQKFELNNNKIYLKQDEKKLEEQDTDDCDLGWC